MGSAAVSSSGREGFWRLLALTVWVSVDTPTASVQTGGPTTQTPHPRPLALGCEKGQRGIWQLGAWEQSVMWGLASEALGQAPRDFRVGARASTPF